MIAQLKIIDPRHLEGIQEQHFYSPSEAAELLTCSSSLILNLCYRSNSSHTKTLNKAYQRAVDEQKRYTTAQVARILNCSGRLIYKLRQLGQFDQIYLNASARIPGWSVLDFIKNHSYRSPKSKLEFISVNSLIRIPGWALRELIKRNADAL